MVMVFTIYIVNCGSIAVFRWVRGYVWYVYVPLHYLLPGLLALESGLSSQGCRLLHEIIYKEQVSAQVISSSLASLSSVPIIASSSFFSES